MVVIQKKKKKKEYYLHSGYDSLHMTGQGFIEVLQTIGVNTISEIMSFHWGVFYELDAKIIKTRP